MPTWFQYQRVSGLVKMKNTGILKMHQSYRIKREHFEVICGSLFNPLQFLSANNINAYGTLLKKEEGRIRHLDLTEFKLTPFSKF